MEAAQLVKVVACGVSAAAAATTTSVRAVHDGKWGPIPHNSSNSSLKLALGQLWGSIRVTWSSGRALTPTASTTTSTTCRLLLSTCMPAPHTHLVTHTVRGTVQRRLPVHGPSLQQRLLLPPLRGPPQRCRQQGSRGQVLCSSLLRCGRLVAPPTAMSWFAMRQLQGDNSRECS